VTVNSFNEDAITVHVEYDSSHCIQSMRSSPWRPCDVLEHMSHLNSVLLL